MVESKGEEKVFQANINLKEAFINTIIISNKNRIKAKNTMLEIRRCTEFSQKLAFFRKL